MPKTRDHSGFEVKLLLRRRLRDGVEPAAMVDFFAGEGRLLLALAGAFDRARAVERDLGRADRLRARLAAAGLDRVQVFTGDNRALAVRALDGLDPTFLDFDAFGNPHPFIRQVFEIFTVRRKTAIAVTDGSRIQIARAGRVRLCGWRARPGAADEISAANHPLLRSGHELLVRAFWDRLAADRGFNVIDFFGAWPRGRRVFYYGLWIEPRTARNETPGGA